MKMWNIPLLMLMYFLSLNANAVLMSEVGSYDVKIAEDTLASSGSAIEEAWIEGILGFDIDYTQWSDASSEGDTPGNWESVTDGAEGDYAFDFGLDEPIYYLIKTGGGSGAGADETHYLFENSVEMNWAYLNLSDFGSGVSLTNIGIISHVGTSGGTVPEPSVIALFAIGLVGLGLVRRGKSQL